MTDTAKIVGARIEHWMDKRIRLKQPIDDPTNIIRISATALLKMNEERNRLVGKRQSLFEASQEHAAE